MPRFFNPYSRFNRTSPSTGFTLLEILIAIFIFAVVVTTIFGSFNFVFSTTDSFESGMAIYESARNCLNRMTTDLQAVHVAFPPAFAPPGSGASPDPYRIFTETNSIAHTVFPRLRFSSLAHVDFEKSQQEGIAEIVYYVQPGDNQTFILRRSDSLYPYKPFQEKGTDPVLCENLKSLKFTFYNTAGIDSDHWDSDSAEHKYATPRAVAILLELADKSFSHQFTTLVVLPAYRLESE